MRTVPNRFFWIFCVLLLLSACGEDTLIEEITTDAPLSLRQVLSDKKNYEVQVIYVQIDRDAENIPSFTEYNYNYNRIKYFYPASAVKLPVAVLALDKINRLNIPGLTKESRMQIDSVRYPQSTVLLDLTSPDSLPSVGHYIHKICAVSDNEAYNRLYEFVGQDEIHDRLQELGISHTRILHRLADPRFGPDENRYTNPVMFFDSDTLVYAQPEVYAEGRNHPKLAGEVKGAAHVNSQGELIPAPFDFSRKNFYPLGEQVEVLKRIMFPDVYPDSLRFQLSTGDHEFLWREMSALPRESDHPEYLPGDFYDSFVKFFMFGDSKAPIPGNIRIFNSVGWAYGYLTECAYIVDFKNNIEFILAATVHVNANNTYNDGEYEEDEIGIPFLAELGRQVYDYEMNRSREYIPDLSAYKPDQTDE